MTVPNIFVNGTVADADEVNENFRAVDNAETVLENSINIVKLQYCASVTDVDHDYMVVDVFTDSNGYNNTLCLDNITNCNRSYDSTCASYICCISSCYLNNTFTFTNYYCNGCFCHNLNIDTSGGSGAAGDAYANFTGCIFLNNTIDISNIDYFKYNMCICHCSCYRCSGTHRACTFSCLNLTWDYGNWSCVLNAPNINCACWGTRNTILEYFKISTNCWKVYKDSSYLCDITLTQLCDLPKVCITCGWIRNRNSTDDANSSSIGMRICYMDFCTIDKNGTTSCYLSSALNGYYRNTQFCTECITETKIVTVPIEYSQAAQSSYLTLDKSGAGTILYNVYDATTSCKIGDNLQLNTHNLLTACVQCHYYEIIQCSDAVSCIKSYAILAGEA
jgi:hypothetical protein